MTNTASIPRHADDHMKLAISLARKSPPKPTNYCVGAVLINPDSNEELATGYTLECEGNTHAEQCCFIKFAESRGIAEDRLIIAARNIKTVYVGVREPEKFVGENEGRKKLEEHGIQFAHVPGFEKEILEVATAGHVREDER
ncbi:hypothetical protein LTR16_004181 [Cryomyces antarcticus]|uniref:CMP/dCMP-type deaminase domain-containing protein n=1 Tax=Cryomyces antarcticus TaxID=329879 RepID=A0ABR0LNC1_9PEZI|nr:hypothetical protein LTR60_003440 [Cryomyces antarcticus]KAK5201001.1 hypothetical protein LTR16_004181 [Cryomyces antarcticus]